MFFILKNILIILSELIKEVEMCGDEEIVQLCIKFKIIKGQIIASTIVKTVN